MRSHSESTCVSCAVVAMLSSDLGRKVAVIRAIYAEVREVARAILSLRDHHLVVHRSGNSSASRSVLIEWPSTSVPRPYRIHWLPCQRSVTPRPSTACRNVRMFSEGVFLSSRRSIPSFL